jgi:hypothetical protein
MAKKFTQEEACIEFSICGRILLDKYINTTTPCLVRLKQCGHEKPETLREARDVKKNGYKCQKCPSIQRLTQEKAAEEFLRCGRVLLNFYEGNHISCLVKIIKCEHEKYEALSNLQRSKKNGLEDNCTICDPKLIPRPFTQEQAEEEFLKCGRKLLSEYKNNSTACSVEILACGHKKPERLGDAQSSFKNKRKCKQCISFKNDICRKFAIAERGRLKDAMARFNVNKKASAVKDLGCTLEEAVAHIESLWESGMNWGNWGRGPGKWNIDHIRPLASFDLESREEQLKAVHYTNLQPLWAHDNLSKGAKWSPNV